MLLRRDPAAGHLRRGGPVPPDDDAHREPVVGGDPPAGRSRGALHRVRDFEQRLGAPPAIVADRLRVFCELGIFEQVLSPDRADWTTYHLTDKGRGFFPVVVRPPSRGDSAGSAPSRGPRWSITTGRAGGGSRPGCSGGKRGTALRGQDVVVER